MAVHYTGKETRATAPTEIEAIKVSFDQQDSDWPEYYKKSTFWLAVLEASQQLQVPIEMAIMCALGAISTACQNRIDVEMPVGIRVQTPLMLLTLAESGERKTTVQNAFFKSIIKHNRIEVEKWEASLEEHSDLLEMWKLEESALVSEYKKSHRERDHEAIELSKQAIKKHKGNKPKMPVNGQILYDDTTPDALVEQLYENSKNACLLTSEANSAFSGRAFHDLDKLNTLWDGGDVTVSRLSRKAFVLSDAHLTLALMTQPEVIERFISKRGEEARGMGFLARFMVVKARQRAGSRPTRKVSEMPYIDVFNERINQILEQPQEQKRILKFDFVTQDKWMAYAQGIEEAMKDGQPYVYYKDHASKLMNNVSRVAGLIHYFENFDYEHEYRDKITEKTLDFSYSLIRKFSTHFQRYLAGQPQIIDDANLLANFLIEQAKKSNNYYSPRIPFPEDHTPSLQITFTLTQIKQFGPNQLRKRENSQRLIAALKLLEELGHVKQYNQSYYFRESVIGGSPPKLRNGLEYYVEALPLLSEQKTFIYLGHLSNYETEYYLTSC